MKLDTLLKKVQSHESVRSPPPPIAPLKDLLRRKRKPVDKFAHVRCKVDTSAPLLRPAPPLALRGTAAAIRLQRDNMMLLRLIRDNHYTRGRVDCSWRVLPAGNRQYHAARVNFSDQTYRENQRLYKIFTSARPRLTPTAELERWWARTVRERERRARGAWLLTAPTPRRDPAFDAPEGVIRPKVKLSLRVRNGAALGSLTLELFTEACPLTCAMFTALLPFYVGTYFHRKVPGLYWRGGGGACATCAFPPENFHFPHSEPGLLSMQVSPDDEVSGIFNVTFKALPQFDLHSVVFGRVVLPSRTYDAIRTLGSPLGSQPIVEITAASLIPRRKPDIKHPN